jgi:hypothetical protein
MFAPFRLIRPAKLVVYAILLATAGCSPLKEVSTFALASQSTMDKAAAFDGYGHFCLCNDSAIVYNDTGQLLRSFNVDCDPDSIPDTVLRNAYNVIGAYFAALAKLADSKTVIKTTTLNNAFAAGTYGSVTISSTEAGIFSALTTAAQDLLTNNYKSKKIKEVLRTYHDTVSAALTDLMDLTETFKGKVREMGVIYKRRMDFLVNKNDPAAVRLTLVTLYRTKMVQWRQIEADYDRRYKALAAVRDGHEALFKNVDNLRDENFKKKVVGFAQNIIYLSQ